MKKLIYSLLTLILGLVLSGAGCIKQEAPELGVTINGVTWATRNVDAPGKFADRPEDSGMFYQWNRNIGWSATDPKKNSEGGVIWNATYSTATVWAPGNDPCPKGWRVPTKTELEKLDNVAVVKAAEVKGGKDVVSFTDGANTLFMPIHGVRLGTDGELVGVGTFGTYISSTEGTANDFAFSLTIRKALTLGKGDMYKNDGGFVRCVKE